MRERVAAIAVYRGCALAQPALHTIVGLIAPTLNASRPLAGADSRSPRHVTACVQSPAPLPSRTRARHARAGLLRRAAALRCGLQQRCVARCSRAGGIAQTRRARARRCAAGAAACAAAVPRRGEWHTVWPARLRQPARSSAERRRPVCERRGQGCHALRRACGAAGRPRRARRRGARARSRRRQAPAPQARILAVLPLSRCALSAPLTRICRAGSGCLH